MFKKITLWLYLVLMLFASNIVAPFEINYDISFTNEIKRLHPKSHINVYIPSLPYAYVAKATNAGLVRAYDNKKGWIYDLASSHERIDDFTYIFEIRKNLKFQDGTNLTIDNIIRNLEFFKKYPYTYTNIDKVGFDVEKIDNTHFKIFLKERYEMLMFDLARIYIYTDEYLAKFAPKGSETGASNKIPGPYGAGPYIQKSGYALGKKQTETIELEANPYFWNKNYPKIKYITVFTQLDMKEAVSKVANYEGKLDITPIPFNKKLDILLSPHSKLILRESTNNFILYFNLINGNEKLKDLNVRRALNFALNQQNLLNFVYKNEGKVSPFSTSINYDIVEIVSKKYKIEEYSYTKNELKNLLAGVTLNIFTQDRFMFLFKGIEYQLQEYGVTFKYMITTSEKDIYGQLLNTYKEKNTQNWDILAWGDDDWFYKNPWTVFFIYEPGSPWSMIRKDDVMSGLINKYFKTKVCTKEYEEIVKDILFYARKQAYTLRVPSPNKVVAVNKEIIYKPSKGGIIPLWEISISKNHWSVRGKRHYPKSLKNPIKPKRVKDEIYQ